MSAPTRSRRRATWFVLPCIFFAFFGCSAPTREPVRHELTEVDFFNELDAGGSSRRYRQREDFKQRYIDVAALGDKGFLPAKVAAKVLLSRYPKFTYDKAALTELLSAAQLGNDSAACALWVIMLRRDKEYPELNHSVLRPLVKRASANGHGGCMTVEALDYLEGRDGYQKNQEKAHQLLLKAATQGHFYAQLAIARRISKWPRRDDWNDIKRVEANLCWLAMADQHGIAHFQIYVSGVDMASILGEPEYDVKEENRPILKKLSNDWATPPPEGRAKFSPPASQCIELERKATNDH